MRTQKINDQTSFQKIKGTFMRRDELDTSYICQKLVNKFVNNPNWQIDEAHNQFHTIEDVFKYHFEINSTLKSPEERIAAEKTIFDEIIKFAKEKKLLWSFERTESKKTVQISAGSIFD